MKKNSPEPVDIEDYSTFKMDTGVQLELNADGTIVAEKKVNDISTTNGGATTDVLNETKGGETNKSTLKIVDLKDAECQTNIQASDMQLSDCLEGDEEFEFLDSKTGVYMTNKVEIVDEVDIKEEVNDDDDNEEMVELIEVDDEEDFEIEVKPTTAVNIQPEFIPIDAPIQCK